MEYYEELEMEVILLEASDVILCSDPTPGGGGEEPGGF